MDIIETERFGIANTIDGKIYLHPRLKEFPELRERIIRHELEHTKQKSWMGQRKVDALTELKFSDLFQFYRKYPKSFFLQHSPITYINNTLYFEWTLIFLYLFYAGVGALIIWLISIFSKDSAFFWGIIQYMFWIFLGIMGLYFIGKKLREYINEQANPKKVPVVFKLF